MIATSRDKVLEGLIQLTYLPTQHQLADILTKTVPSEQLKLLSSKIGLFDTTSTHPILREDNEYIDSSVNSHTNNIEYIDGDAVS